jgi:SAM-dependent methyltransferase
MQPFLSVPDDWRKPLNDISFEVWKCPHDGFAKVLPTPSGDVLADHYDIDDYYTHSEGRKATYGTCPAVFRLLESLAWRGDHGLQDPLPYLMDMLRSRNLTRVLDIGAGTGVLLTRLDAAGFTVAGVEPDGNARSRQLDFPLSVHAGSAENIPEALNEKSFDLVLMTHVFEHVADPMAVLFNCRRLLSDQGRVFIEVPNADCRDFHWNPLGWQHLGIPRHLNFWIAAAARAAFERAGLVPGTAHRRSYRRQPVVVQ